MKQEAEGFIGSRLKNIPHSHLLHYTNTQLLLLAKRQTIRLDTIQQTLVYSNIDDEKIVHSSYHSSLELYLLLSEHNILAINQEGELIKKLPNEGLFGCKYFFFVAMTDGYYGLPNNRNDFVIFVKGDHLYTAKVKVFYERAMIKNKGICDFNFQLDPPELLESPEYIEDQKYLPDCDLLVLWNTNQTYIYRLPNSWLEKFERLYIYNRISKRENRSLDYAITLEHKIMAVAYQSGVIKIFQLDWTKKYLQQLRGHQTTCHTLLIPPKNQYFLYSAAADSTVRIWNLKDYQQVYMLQLDVLIDQVKFITESLLFINNNELKGKTYLCEINTNLLVPMVNDNKGGHLVKMKCDKQWCVSIYSNNLVEFFSIFNQQKHIKNENEKIEYPMKYGFVRDIFAIGNDRYAISLQKGFSLIKFDKKEIRSENFQLKKLVYNESIVKAREADDEFIELIHQKLLGTYLFNALSDWKDIPTSLKVTYVYFHINKWLPMWDSSSQVKVKPNATPTTFCLLGTSKGEIYFVDIEKRTHFYTKVYFHIAEVTFIREVVIEPSDPQKTYFLSISKDKQVAIWKLDHQDFPKSLLLINYNLQISLIDVYYCFLVIGQKNGELSIAKVMTQNEQIKLLKSTNSIGHLRAIICCDYMFYKKHHIFLSGGEDSVIKIWRGLEKEMIYQLKLFGIISTANFVRQNLNVIVCHNEQISFLKQQKLKDLRKIDEKLNETEWKCEYAIEEIDVKDFFFRYHLPDPPSPLKRTTHNNKSKYSHISQYLQKKISKFQDIEVPLLHLPKNEESNQFSMLTNMPRSMLNMQSVSKANHRYKRFHISSSNDPNSVDLFLPRIATKQSIPSSNKTFAKSVKREREVISELRHAKDKSYSYAGKKKE